MVRGAWCIAHGASSRLALRVRASASTIGATQHASRVAHRRAYGVANKHISHPRTNAPHTSIVHRHRALPSTCYLACRLHTAGAATTTGGIAKPRERSDAASAMAPASSSRQQIRSLHQPSSSLGCAASLAAAAGLCVSATEAPREATATTAGRARSASPRCTSADDSHTKNSSRCINPCNATCAAARAPCA